MKTVRVWVIGGIPGQPFAGPIHLENLKTELEKVRKGQSSDIIFDGPLSVYTLHFQDTDFNIFTQEGSGVPPGTVTVTGVQAEAKLDDNLCH